MSNSNNENVKIYIAAHTDFECPVSNPVYEILDSRRILNDDKAEDGMDALFYSELASYMYVARHYDLPEYVGFCGYRKYFAFLDQIPDIPSLIARHGCVATEPFHVKGSIARQYAKCFCFADLEITQAIIQGAYPRLYYHFRQMLQSDWLYACNMFIMRSEDFKRMMCVVWDILHRLLDIIGTDILARIRSHPHLYLGKKGILSQPAHQFRIGGNIGERIVSAFICQRFTAPKVFPMVITEDRKPYKKL